MSDALPLLEDWVKEVLEIYPDVPEESIRKDLAMTKSKMETVIRILDGHIEKVSQVETNAPNSLAGEDLHEDYDSLELSGETTDDTDYPDDSLLFPTPVDINSTDNDIAMTNPSPLFSPMDITPQKPQQTNPPQQKSAPLTQNQPESPDFLEIIDISLETPQAQKQNSNSTPQLIELDFSDDDEEEKNMPSTPPITMEATRKPSVTSNGTITLDDEEDEHVQYKSFSQTNLSQSDPSYHLEENNMNFTDLIPNNDTQNSYFIVSKPKNPSHAEIILILDENLTEVPSAPKNRLSLRSIREALANNTRHVFPLYCKPLTIPFSIEWRRIPRPRFKKETEMKIEVNKQVLSEAMIEKFVIILMSVEEFYILAKDDKLEAYCKRATSLHSLKQITMLVVGIGRWKRLKDNDYAAIDTLEEAITWVQFESSLHFHQSETNSSAASFIELFSESIAESLYKSKSKFDRFCAEAAGKSTSGGQSGDPFHVFGAQLQQISGISEPIAAAITAHFPTVQSLYRHYARKDLSIAQKQLLLKDLPIANRNSTVGKKKSERVYQLFTEEIPDRNAL